MVTKLVRVRVLVLCWLILLSLHVGHGELGESSGDAILRLVLGCLPVAHDVDGGVRFRVEVGLHEGLVLVATELRDSDPLRRKRGRELLVLLLHPLAELAPRGVHYKHGLLVRLLEGERLLLRRDVHHLGVHRPQIAIEGLLSARHVDTALRLHGAVRVLQTHEATLALLGVVQPRRLLALELEVHELHGPVLGDGDGVLGITDGGVALRMKGMVEDLVLGDVVEGVLEGPVGEGVNLGEATTDGRALIQVDPRALDALPAGAAVDHHVAAGLLEAALEGLDLAHAIVLLNVNLPQVRTVLRVVHALVRAVLRLVDLCLEVVGLLNILQELHGLGEEMEGVHAHHLALAARQVAEAMQKVSDDGIASNHRVGEHRVAEPLDGKLERTHSLLLQMLQPVIL
mmetsp:Transcript_38608/g.64974  ORF Transcript_38608/g.64974 Transcript_38608/m.64974 type:complete len:400 (+) Transcript_38608:73-1272(+)